MTTSGESSAHSAFSSQKASRAEDTTPPTAPNAPPPPACRPERAHTRILNTDAFNVGRAAGRLQPGDRIRAGAFGLHLTEASCGGRADKRLGAVGMISGSLRESSAATRPPHDEAFESSLAEMERAWQARRSSAAEGGAARWGRCRALRAVVRAVVACRQAPTPTDFPPPCPQADLLSVAFDRPIVFNTHIANGNVLRQQHLTVVVLGKQHSVSAARIDLCKLVEPSMLVPGMPTTVQLHEPIVRNGLVVGYLSGRLTLAVPQPPSSFHLADLLN